MSNAIGTAPLAPQVITKQFAVPTETLIELGLRTDQPIHLPVEVVVQPPPAEVAARSRQAVASVIGPAVVAGSTAAVAYVLGAGAIDAGVLQQFPANLTWATGVTAAVATGSGLYSVALLRQAAANAFQVPRLNLGLAAPRWLLDAASELRVGVKTAATFVSATVTGAAIGLATSSVGAALLGAGTALSEPQTWIAAGVGAVAAIGTFFFGRGAVKSATALADKAVDSLETSAAAARLEIFKDEVRLLQQQAAAGTAKPSDS